MNTNIHYIITTFTSQEKMSNIDIVCTLKNIVNSEQNYLENCPQKAQTEESVNHAKEKKTTFFVQGSKTQVQTHYIMQQIVTVPSQHNAVLTVLNTVHVCNNTP